MPNKFTDLSPKALDDIRGIADYLQANSNVQTGTHFITSIFHSFDMLLDNSRIGHVRDTPNSTIPNLRQWSVNGFSIYQIIYSIIPSGIFVVRVLHGARDIDSIMSEDDSPGD